MGPSLSNKDKSVAWLDAPGNIRLIARGEDRGDPLQRAVPRLICGVSSQFGDEKLRWLRNMIWTNDHISRFEEHLVKVCAKRVRHAPELNPLPDRNWRIIDVTTEVTLPGDAIIIPDFASPQAKDTVNALITSSDGHQQTPRHQKNQPIAALLVDGDNKPLLAARNTNLKCRMFHAEINLIQSLRLSGLTGFPDRTSLHVTLKPCRMCAAAILDFAASSHGFHVYALSDQPGTMTRHKLLDGIMTVAQATET